MADEPSEETTGRVERREEAAQRASSGESEPTVALESADLDREGDGVEVEWPREEISDVLRRAEREQAHYPTSQQLERIRRQVSLIAEFLYELEDSAPAVPSVAPPGTSPTVTELGQIARKGRVVMRALAEAPHLTESLANRLDELTGEFERLFNDLLVSFRDELVGGAPEDFRRAALPIVDRYLEKAEARQLTEEARGARDAAVRARDESRRAAGVTGETALATHFGDYARRERRAANVLRLTTASILIAIALFAGLLLFHEGKDSTLELEDFAKLSLTLPLGALATYLGRESSRHRRASLWASELEVQLLTLNAFTESMPDSLRDEIRVELGRRVFTSAASTEPGKAQASSVADASNLLEHAAELVRVARAP
jgi:hypothetical protein